MNPQQLLESGIESLDPFMIQEALTLGANPFETQSGPSPASLIVEKTKGGFSESMWRVVAEVFDIAPENSKQMAELKSTIASVAHMDGYSSGWSHILKKEGLAYSPASESVALQQGSVSRLHGILSRSNACDVCMNVEGFPEELSRIQTQFYKDGQTDASLDYARSFSSGSQRSNSSSEEMLYTENQERSSSGYTDFDQENYQEFSDKESQVPEDHRGFKKEDFYNEDPGLHSSLPKLSVSFLKSRLGSFSVPKGFKKYASSGKSS